MSNALISFYHNLKEPIIIYDKKSDTLYHNLSFEKIFDDFNNTKGLDNLNKLSGRFNWQVCFLHPPEDYKAYNPIVNAIKNNWNYSEYAIYQKEENSFFHFLVKAFSVKHYRIVYFYDITTELRLERLKEENERLRAQNIEFARTNSKAQNQAVKMALLNRISQSLKSELNIKALIETTLRELNIIFGANKGYFALFNKNDFQIKYTHPEVFAPQIGEIVKYSKDLTDSLQKGECSILPCLKEHEGASIPLLNSTTRIIMPILNNEKLYGIAVIFTPRKEVTDLERELLVGISHVVTSALIQAGLFHQISQKKEELENTINELKETQLQLINSEKMASLGQLVASVAHEINTPLGAINANNEMMETIFEKYDKKSIDILKEMNAVDKEAIKRIANMVGSLKRFVRLDEAIQQEADINSELDLTLTLLHHKLKHGFEIEKDYGKIPYINCFVNMLNQVFLNVLMNSIHSIEDVKEKDNSYTGKIKIETKTDDDNLLINIYDNGKGIEKSDQNKIFTAGFTTKQKGKGTGLGLAICKKIIEKHNGSITFKSGKLSNTSDYKTVFEIKIPIS